MQEEMKKIYLPSHKEEEMGIPCSFLKQEPETLLRPSLALAPEGCDNLLSGLRVSSKIGNAVVHVRRPR